MGVTGAVLGEILFTETAAVTLGVGLAAYGAVEGSAAAHDAEDAANRQAGEVKKQAAEQRKQYEAQQRIADIKNARERAQFVRNSRIAQARVVNQGANTGTLLSSGVAGGVSGVQTQTAAGLGGMGAIQENQSDIFASQEAQAESVGRAGTAGASLASAQAQQSSSNALFSLGKDIFTAGGGFKTVFDKSKDGDLQI